MDGFTACPVAGVADCGKHSRRTSGFSRLPSILCYTMVIAMVAGMQEAAMKWLVITAVLASTLVLTPAANAQSRYGYAVTNVNLRSGPDLGYPGIAVVPVGDEVLVQGCLDDWSWCDVSWQGLRGWMAGGLIEYDYADGRVEIQDYGPQLGLPVVSFIFDLYWSNYYRDRPWYRERVRWSHYRPPPRPH